MVGKTGKLESIVNTVVDKVTKNFDVDEIILFGSYAKGTATELSDVDIAVVSPELSSSNSLFKNTRIIKEKADIIIPSLQLMAFSSDSFYRGKYIDLNFIREIKSTGKTLYSKTNNSSSTRQSL